MFGWLHKLRGSDDETAYNTVVNTPPENKATLSHELIAAAASYEAAKAYAAHCEAEGKPESHAKAKELIAAFSGAFIDRMVETKGLDFIDKEKAKHDGEQQAIGVGSEEILAAEFA
ncbi:Mitochondrial carrier protein [Mycena chlorophos]|uniref:Mitochondrial carrier protein n=1 Tax=Mycena chlorophos TaxID=658473 RepID=A0A8H6VSH9_MYCCL|nr:Mitochondrial carrier protein [Mycena chlorophos]